MNLTDLHRWEQSFDDAARTGLYSPDTEHDACGVGFVANLRGERSHAVVSQALTVLANLAHRGATGADPLTGDGAGLLIQIPHRLLARECAAIGMELPAPGAYGAGALFLPREPGELARAVEMIEAIVREEDQVLLGWRDVPVDEAQCGDLARTSLPTIRQLFVKHGTGPSGQEALERKLFVIRKRIGHEAERAGIRAYVVTLSSRTIGYKGLLMAHQVPEFYSDLRDPLLESAIAVVHQRFSTNTMPSWERAQPLRMVGHNGEINTLRGNVNWMRAREALLASEAFGDDLQKLLPIIVAQGSDSAMFDNALELLVHTGRSLPHALMMMVPEAWQKTNEMSDERRAFYEYHSCLMEPWDGPAALAFTDGRIVGAMLDRNGLRPARYVVTHDGLVVMASESGVLDIDPERVATRQRVQPGRMIVVDTVAQRIVGDDAIKEEVARRRPYRRWIDERLVRLAQLPDAAMPETAALFGDALARAQRAHGYSQEDLHVLLAPMAESGQEALGSMGNDAPLAVLSDRPQLLFAYFKQLFAQVTNPPIDPIREAMVMSLRTTLGPQRNLFDETPEHADRLELAQPVLSNDDLARLLEIDVRGLRAVRIAALFDVAAGGSGLEAAVRALCERAAQAVSGGVSLLVLSDRGHDAERAPIPSLLATAAVHYHLMREGLRARCSIVVESGEPREVMHFALLIGYGAGAVNPYVAIETLRAMAADGTLTVSAETARSNFVKAIGKGIYKVMSKMGISTLDSYRGAQIFEAVGLSRELIERFFTRTSSRLSGIGLSEIARETAMRHEAAYGPASELDPDLDDGGEYRWRRRGERHAYEPDVIATLQHAARKGNYAMFKKYSALVNDESERHMTIRGLLELQHTQPAVPLSEVEPATAIVKRFKTGAMSFGSISKEAHETLAVAMNSIGARSNTGEGGEDPERFSDQRRSAIKQVASGRFGVTSHYLVNADELQIKMAQGAKPGEGGQLPGHKVDANIARLRFSTPGVGLISPPPHHDIYSIEDLAQLIHDLKNANDRARISVKLVAEVGVGTVAAGVAKAGAETILISGDSGGTGASPLSSIKHAGVPWELGLSEAQQVLVLNKLRGRVRLETDGQLKTGRDVAVAALLGAEEFGFATAALVASGCILMRACHLNTCPVGVATQDPRLRERFTGKPEHVVNLMMFIAEELREIMAELGFRTVDEMVGRSDLLAPRDVPHWKARTLDLSPILHRPERTEGQPVRWMEEQDHGLELALDRRLIEMAAPALERGEPVQIEQAIRNVDRTVGTMLSAEISRRWGRAGLPAGTIDLRLHGTGGQSFGAFLANGIDVLLEGDANDYFGKGLSGGRIAVVPPERSRFRPDKNVIVGNVALYGATGGEVYINGLAGERFAVRNSGATAVVEGIGDHGCEYMTAGTVVVLGTTGRNFAAGMSGGVAYVLDEDGLFFRRCNQEMVELEALDEEDVARVRQLVHRHVELTESRLAWRVLSGFRTYAAHLVKVMPTDYKRALEQSRELTAQRHAKHP